MRFDSSFMESNHNDVRNWCRAYWQRGLIFSNIVPRNNHLFFCRWGKVPVLETEMCFSQWAANMAGNMTGCGTHRRQHRRKTGSAVKSCISPTLYSSARWEKFWVKYSSVSSGTRECKKSMQQLLTGRFANVSGQTENKLTNVKNWEHRFIKSVSEKNVLCSLLSFNIDTFIGIQSLQKSFVNIRTRLSKYVCDTS